MSANSQVLQDLQSGHIIGTDNRTCSRYGVNKMPDVIYQLRANGFAIETLDKWIIRNGKRKKVAQYQMVVS